MSQARKLARQALVQALYQWQIAEQSLQSIETQFREEKTKSKIDMEYFVDLLHAIPTQKSDLDDLIGPCVDRTLQDVNPVELAILRMATYELKYRIDVPYRVVINESVDLAKKYGADQGHKFVNSVLDKLAKQLRTAEVSAKKKS